MAVKLGEITLENYAQVAKSRQKRSKRKLRPELIFDIYEMVKANEAQVNMVKMLGVTTTTFTQWITHNPTVRLAVAKANEVKRMIKEAPSAHSLIKDSLDPELQEIWDELSAFHNDSNNGQRAQALMERSSKESLQHLWIHAWWKCNFQKTKACRFLGIHPSVLDTWKTEEKFQKLVVHLENSKKDFIEDALMNLVYKGESAAILFANKTLNRDRGYNEKTEVHHTGGTNSTVTHQHKMLIDLDELDLPIEVQAQIMDAMDNKRLSEKEEEDRKLIHV